MRLKGKTALVTGAGRGIGRAVALDLAREGASVVICGRTESDLLLVQQEIEAAGGRALAVRADVTVKDDITRLFRSIHEGFGRLDVLVNNAGLGRFAPVKDLRIEDFDAMWDLNLRGLFLCTQEALALMIPQKSGDIINISSLAGKNEFIGGAGYAATKWGLMGFSNCLRLEVREHNIRVITICPGSVATDFSPNAKDPVRIPKILAAEDVSATVIHVLTMPGRAMVSEIDIRPTNPK